jgi:ribonuclease-3 family protein
MTDYNPASIPPQLLAYLGDAVFEMMVRRKMLSKGILPSSRLHRKVTRYVRARGQADILRNLEPYLTEQEADIVRRGRNTRSRVPKNADMASYRRATGLEALFGYLYLGGEEARLQELFSLIKFEEEENE